MPSASPPTKNLKLYLDRPQFSLFRDILRNALNKIHDTNKVKYNTRHYCTAVANRRGLIDKK